MATNHKSCMVTVHYNDNIVKPCSPATARKLIREKFAIIAPRDYRGRYAIRINSEAGYNVYAASFRKEGREERHGNCHCAGDR